MNTRPASLQSPVVGPDGLPDYLTRHYWWAYLWPFSRAFFDHPAIISAILFGHYRTLRDATLKQLAAAPTPGKTLQLTCVYGDLSNRLMDHIDPAPLHLTDVAELQLDLARSKAAPERLQATRMNVEQLAYRDGGFNTVLIFFLLHELPAMARARVLRESLRVLSPGGRLLITEYSEQPERHLLYRSRLLRGILKRAEPFLDGFWHEDLTALLREQTESLGRTLEMVHEETRFRGFYRVLEFRVDG